MTRRKTGDITKVSYKGERGGRMNPQALKVRMTEMSVTQANMADRIGLSLSRFNAKVHGWRGAEFTLQEIQKMKMIRLKQPQQ